MSSRLPHLHGETLSSTTFDGDAQQWIFHFSGSLTLQVASAWRMVSATEIVIGFHDDGHRFGLGSPVNAAERITQLVGAKTVSAATFNRYGDLEVQFGPESVLQVFNDSCGYEGWQLYGPGDRYVVAQGGGRVIDSGNDR